ncbi:hypothetical protein PMKS-003424 [Pichia membranifaciens]|uniref:Uncharacterized protein n=1 Tax=Pichia membranifaciens TaxID=4926 RepID=A0A1Q2YK30_9ASCO|nr:hypothetical protein PMKS-003424 [Pichia membranifaciens]
MAETEKFPVAVAGDGACVRAEDNDQRHSDVGLGPDTGGREGVPDGARAGRAGNVSAWAGAAHTGGEHPCDRGACRDMWRHPRPAARPGDAVQDWAGAADEQVPLSGRLCRPGVLLAGNVFAAAGVQA